MSDEELRGLKRAAEAGGDEELLAYAEARSLAGLRPEKWELERLRRGLGQAAVLALWDGEHDLYKRWSDLLVADSEFERAIESLREGASEAHDDLEAIDWSDEKEAEEEYASLNSVIDFYVATLAEEALLRWEPAKERVFQRRDLIDRWISSLDFFGRDGEAGSFDIDSVVEQARLRSAALEKEGREFLVYHELLARLGLLEGRKEKVSEEAAEAWAALSDETLLVRRIDGYLSADEDEDAQLLEFKGAPRPFELVQVAGETEAWRETTQRWLESDVEVRPGFSTTVKGAYLDPIWYVKPVSPRPRELKGWRKFWVHGIGRRLDGRTFLPEADWEPESGRWPS